MYTALIVEDEILVRIGIASLVPWMQLGVKVVSETEDGLSAWNAFNQLHPDIVIADIRIPKMNGIELLRKIREVDPQCAVILVTNVESGDTLAEARRMGVVDVLLKVSMKRDDITDAVRRAVESLPKDRDRHVPETDHDEQWRSALASMGIRELNDENADPVVNPKPVSNIAALPKPYGYALMHVRPSKSLSYRLKTSLYNMFLHQLEVGTGEFCSAHLEEACLVLARKPMNREKMDRVLLDLERYVRDNFDEQLYFVVREGKLDFSALQDQLRRAIVWFENIQMFDFPILYMDAEGDVHLPELAAAVRRLKYCILMSEYDARLNRSVELMEAFPRIAAGGWDEAKLCGEEIQKLLGAAVENSGLHEMVKVIIRAIDRRYQDVCLSKNAKVLEAVDYIEAHLSDKLTIQQVSEHIGYHPVYFSNLFKAEIGMSYTDFLTTLRIRRAQRMIREEQCSFREIAERCGFADFSYFSAKFKRVVGMSPREWRRK